MRIALSIGQGLLILCLPILLVTTNIRWAVNSITLYEWGFNRYQVSLATGLANSELEKTAKQLVDYFNSRRDTVQVVVLKEGREIELFTEREIIHLQDVKNLVQFGYHVQISLLVFMGIFGLILWLWWRREWWQILTKSFLWGSVFTLALLISLGLVTVFGFDQFFLLFHIVSFPNEYWILDPGQHYLIMMFPQGFFQDAALIICGATLIQALLLGSITFSLRKLDWRH